VAVGMGQSPGFMPANFMPHLQSNMQVQAPAPIAASLATMKAVNVPKQIIRGQAPEETKSISMISMPMPDHFGIQNGKVALVQINTAQDLDWALVHNKLREVGSVCFQSDKTTAGYRVLCMVPGKLAGSLQRFESTSDTEVQAVHLLLVKLNEWQAGR